MSDLARLPSYPSPTTLIARSGIQFLDFGFDPVRLKVREWGFHDAAADKAVDDLVQLDFDEVRGQYEVVENGRRRAAEPNLVVTAKDALAPFLDKWVPVPFLQVRPNNQFREGPADWARVRVVDLEARYGAGYRDEQGHRYRCVLAFDTGLIAEAEGRAYLAPSPKDVTSGALFALAPAAARQPLAAAPELDDAVAGGAVPRTASARHARGDRGRHQAEAAGSGRALSRLPRPAGRCRALPADQAGRRRRAAGPRRHRGRPRARCRQLAHLRPADRGGGRAGRQPERLL